jgi:hypothetical protein
MPVCKIIKKYLAIEKEYNIKKQIKACRFSLFQSFKRRNMQEIV